MGLGFWTIKLLNLSFCAIPKGGSTMTRQLVAKAAGVLNITGCYPDWEKQTNALFERHGVQKSYSHNTTNIVIVRNPWTRAVSEFADQIARRHIPNNKSHGAFIHYLDNIAVKKYTHHTGTASKSCIGDNKARFDHIIDLENIYSFAKVARPVPAFANLTEHGWENCTHGDPRLYMPGSIALHANKDVDMKHTLCTRESLQKVCKIYGSDYKLYHSLGHPFRCACHTIVEEHMII